MSDASLGKGGEGRGMDGLIKKGLVNHTDFIKSCSKQNQNFVKPSCFKLNMAWNEINHFSQEIYKRKVLIRPETGVSRNIGDLNYLEFGSSHIPQLHCK